MEKVSVLLQMTNRNTVLSFCKEILALGLYVLPCYILLFILKNQILKTAALCDNFFAFGSCTCCCCLKLMTDFSRESLIKCT